ncbi:MAG: aspartate-semialdehyde dehydrogenase [Gammaproteobacteria bacterium]|nr:aspartate-semialdehyde dehydrogenase [Gammaproteobacteria bacterium]
MSKTVDTAVVGATGAVGEAMIEILEERNFPVGKLYLLASERSEGKRLQFRGQHVKVERLDQFDFNKAKLGLFSAGGPISEIYAPKAGKAGCIVVDNTSHFRMEKEIPLIVPEVNPHRLGDFRKHNIIANPNCSTIQMVVALKPIHDAVGITRINVATYQAVSGAGGGGVRELAGQTTAILNTKPVESKVMPVQIAFNAIPQIADFLDNGYTKEEMKMVLETRKILEDDDIQVNPTCVRIPVFFGHSEAVHFETKKPISVADTRQLLEKAPGVVMMEGNSYPTPALNAAGTDPVFVGRLRKDLSHPNGLSMWVVSDNVRKGAALNSVQVAELLLSEGHFG